MKKITYWKLLTEKLQLNEAVQIFHDRKYYGKTYESMMLVAGSHKIEYGKATMSTERFSLQESTEACWSIYVPDYGEEKRLQEVREIVKANNCLGVSFAKIDNMSIKDIWDVINQKYMDNENKALFIKLFIDHIYGKNTNKKKFTKITVWTDWSDKTMEEYDLSDVICINGSKASHEYTEVSFKPDSEFAKKHNTTYVDAVQVAFK